MFALKNKSDSRGMGSTGEQLWKLILVGEEISSHSSYYQEREIKLIGENIS